MNFKSSKCIIAAVLVAVGIPSQLAAQKDQEQVHCKYRLFDLGTFGGPSSFFSDGNPPLSKLINNRGAAVGAADTSTPDPYAPNCFTDCFVAHAFEFQNGVSRDLGALPGVNTAFASAVNEHGAIIAGSENGILDPLTGFPETRAVVLEDGNSIDLGTLGGNASIANGINDLGQVVGVALNATPDPLASGFFYFFVFPIATEARAFLWQNGEIRDLGTLGGPDSVASYINDRGDVAGVSYVNSVPNPASGIPTINPFLWLPCERHGSNKDDCQNDHTSTGDNSGRMLDLGTLGGTFGLVAGLNNKRQVIGQSNLAGDHTRHCFLWERGQMKDLGTLGGDFGYATWLNESGEVVGVASLPIPCPGCEEGPQVYHGFFWKRGVMTDLGTLDKCSIANGINSKSQIVGASGLCGSAKHAFLSEAGGPMLNLNSLVAGGSDLQLTQAIYINDRGEIAGNGLAANGDQHAYVLVPCDSDHSAVEGCDYDAVRTATVRPDDDSGSQHFGTPENSPRTGKYKKPSTAPYRP